MRILVYGAGVIGSVLAAKLHLGGHEVHALARGKRFADIREHGIVLEEVGRGKQSIAQIPAFEQLDPGQEYDLVIVAMQKTQISVVLPILAEHRTSRNVLFLTNNAAGPDEFTETLGRERVLMGLPSFGGVFRDNVVRFATAGKGKWRMEAILGESGGGKSPRLRNILEAFAQAEIRGVVHPNMDAWLKNHVALVLPIAWALQRSDFDNYALAQDRGLLNLLARAQREGFKVVSALGYPTTPFRMKMIRRLPASLSAAVMRKILSTEFAEIALAGHAKAGRAEFKQLAGEFRSLIAESELPTPAIDELEIE